MTTGTQEYTIEDMEIEVPEAPEFYTVPPGMYNAVLVKLKRIPKPAWKLKGDEETDDDKHQIEWGFRITGGEDDGIIITDFTNLTWHPKATAHKHAAALLGVPELAVGVGLSTGELANKPCQIWVIEKSLKDKPKELRNYIREVTPMPTPRMRPQKPQNGSQSRVGATVQLDGYPAPDDDISFGPEDGA